MTQDPTDLATKIDLYRERVRNQFEDGPDAGSYYAGRSTAFDDVAALLAGHRGPWYCRQDIARVLSRTVDPHTQERILAALEGREPAEWVDTDATEAVIEA